MNDYEFMRLLFEEYIKSRSEAESAFGLVHTSEPEATRPTFRGCALMVVGGAAAVGLLVAALFALAN